jgi:hypothetical protein
MGRKRAVDGRRSPTIAHRSAWQVLITLGRPGSVAGSAASRRKARRRRIGI